MEVADDNLYVKIFYVFGIIAFSMFILWLGSKLYLIINKIIYGQKTSFNEANEAIVAYRRLQSKNSYRDGTTQTSIEELNETEETSEVIYRNNRK